LSGASVCLTAGRSRVSRLHDIIDSTERKIELCFETNLLLEERLEVNRRCQLCSVRTLSALVTILTLQFATARGQVLPLDVPVAGMSQAEWGVLSAKWALETPADMNPLLDTTGEFAFLGDQGDVFFLDGIFRGPPVTRSVTIRDDQHVLVHLITNFDTADEPTDTEAALRASVAARADRFDQLFLEIDGVVPPGLNLGDHRQQSPPGFYDPVFPENNPLGAPVGTFPAVHDGYRVMLEPLSLGDHSIAFGGRAGLFTTSVVYNVSVVPEPASLTLLAAASSLVLALHRRRRSIRNGMRS
jgi:hypothetical protein